MYKPPALELHPLATSQHLSGLNLQPFTRSQYQQGLNLQPFTLRL